MNKGTSNYSLFINSLLSNKEIKINTNNTLKITESSVFKNTKTIIPIDLIETHAKKGSRLDYQWVIFGLVSFIAASIFTLLALTQQFTAVLILGVIFTVLGIVSIFFAFKFKTITHTYLYKGTSMKLFTLSETDLNTSQITEFVQHLDTNNRLDDDNDSFDIIDSTHQLNNRVNAYYEHLNYLHEEGIIDTRLLERLQLKAYNKVYGVSLHSSNQSNDTQTDGAQANNNVINFPVSGT